MNFLSCNSYAHPDTYGVRSIDVTDTSEDTVHIMCLFNTFSTESGCTVKLISIDQQQQYKETFNKTNNTASGNISDVVTGLYNILVFDQGSNVVAVELLSVTITGEPSSTTSNTDTPTSSVATSADSGSTTFTGSTSYSE